MSANKSLATPEELAAFYKQNTAFQEAVSKEYELLRAASDDPSLNATKARRALSQWLKLYRARGADFAAALEATPPQKSAWAMDAFETFLEGSARYVEARFLIAPAEISYSALRDEPTFKSFAASKGKRPSQLEGLGGLGAKYFYAIGMYLCVLLDAADPTWKVSLFSADGLLVEQVARSAALRD